jgi:uncharacterized protein
MTVLPDRPAHAGSERALADGAIDVRLATTHRSRVDSWIARQPLAAYLLLTFSIAWSFWVPLALLYQGGSSLEALISSPLVIVLQTLGVTAPVISAVAVARARGGRAGIYQVLDGLQRSRVGVRWYLVAGLLVPALTVLGIGVRAVLGIDPAVPEGSALAVMLADIGWIGTILTLPLQLLGQCFGSPLLEEPGWRGFAFPHLQDRLPAAWAALLVGAIWGLWHVPLFLAFHDNLAVSLALITMHGFILGWLFANTGSLLIVVLGHASLSVANNSLSLPDQGVVQVALTAALCGVVLTFFRFRDLRSRHDEAAPRLPTQADA